MRKCFLSRRDFIKLSSSDLEKVYWQSNYQLRQVAKKDHDVQPWGDMNSSYVFTFNVFLLMTDEDAD